MTRPQSTILLWRKSQITSLLVALIMSVRHRWMTAKKYHYGTRTSYNKLRYFVHMYVKTCHQIYHLFYASRMWLLSHSVSAESGMPSQIRRGKNISLLKNSMCKRKHVLPMHFHVWLDTSLLTYFSVYLVKYMRTLESQLLVRLRQDRKYDDVMTQQYQNRLDQLFVAKMASWWRTAISITRFPNQVFLGSCNIAQYFCSVIDYK